MWIDSHKEITSGLEVEEYDPDLTDEYVYPVRCGVCRPGEVIVSEGQYVREGQKIIESGRGISACVHASVSGKVVVVEPRSIIGEENVLCVVIKNDKKYTEYNEYTEYERRHIINIVKEAGVIGMGGAGFPAHIKYMVKEPEKIRYIIANAAECEPYVTSDHRMLKERMEEIEGGLKILGRIFRNARLILADGNTITEINGKNKMQGNRADRKKTDRNRTYRDRSGSSRSGSSRSDRCDYPHGAERQLVYAVTGYRLKAGELPFRAGCIVNNVHTLSAVYNAVFRGLPSIKRIVTVTGEGIGRPVNYLVRLGADIQDVIQSCGGLKNDHVNVIAGGPMMGTALNTLHVPVMKTTSGIVCIDNSGSKKRMTECIRCGRCIQVCPCGLKPYRETGETECMGCGCCAYVCPAGRELTLSMHRKG